MLARNAWDAAACHVQYRPYPGDCRGRLDRGVNYFVAALEVLGCRTYASCSGHGDQEQFYVLFRVPRYAVAERIHRCGYFSVVLANTCWNKGRKLFRLELGPPVRFVRVGTAPDGDPMFRSTMRGITRRDRRRQWRQLLRWAAEAWEKNLFGRGAGA